MKTLVVVADSHSRVANVESLRALIEENDYFVHLGDGANDARELYKAYPDKVYLCRGNCDFYAPYPLQYILEVEWLKILCCHGHEYGVKQDLSRLAQEAKRLGCAMAVYGHTHRADIQEIDGVTLVNPGTLQFPVKQGGSYAYLVVNKDKCTPVLVGDSLR